MVGGKARKTPYEEGIPRRKWASLDTQKSLKIIRIESLILTIYRSEN